MGNSRFKSKQSISWHAYYNYKKPVLNWLGVTVIVISIKHVGEPEDHKKIQFYAYCKKLVFSL